MDLIGKISQYRKPIAAGIAAFLATHVLYASPINPGLVHAQSLSQDSVTGRSPEEVFKMADTWGRVLIVTYPRGTYYYPSGEQNATAKSVSHLLVIADINCDGKPDLWKKISAITYSDFYTNPERPELQYRSGSDEFYAARGPNDEIIIKGAIWHHEPKMENGMTTMSQDFALADRMFKSTNPKKVHQEWLDTFWPGVYRVEVTPKNFCKKPQV